VKRLTAIAALALVLAGCDFANDPGEVVLEGNILEMAARSSTPFKTGKPLSIDMMKDSDVIVAVNGYPLTKKAFEDVSIMFVKGLQNKGVDNQLVVSRKLEEFQQSYINKFVGQRVLIDNAFELKLLSTNQICTHVQKKIRDLAKAQKRTVKQVLKGYAPYERYFFYDVALAYVMGRLIDEKIPTLAKVDSNFVQTVQNAVSSMNAAAQTTNDLMKARLADWRQQILDKKIDFKSVARLYSMDSNGKGGNDGMWGEFEESEMDDPGVAAAVFALGKGEISDVLEEENGYHLVKVLDITPAETNEFGRIVQRERRILSHIYLEKQPLLIRQTDTAMMSDLKWQMQSKAINRYIALQITNGTTRVEYPHGKKLFR